MMTQIGVKVIMRLIAWISHLGEKGLAFLYRIRDFVGDSLFGWLLRSVPSLFLWVSADLVSLSRVLCCTGLLIWQPPIGHWYCYWTVGWGGFSDWLDGWLAKRCRKYEIIPYFRLQKWWSLATGSSVDPAADGLSLLQAILYLVICYPCLATVTLALAVIPDILKIPLSIHGYRVLRECHRQQGTIPPDIAERMIRKKRTGEAKILFMFLAAGLSTYGLATNQPLPQDIATVLAGIGFCLGWIVLHQYVRRFLDEFPDLTRWYILPKPGRTWLIARVIGLRDLYREFPPSDS